MRIVTRYLLLLILVLLIPVGARADISCTIQPLSYITDYTAGSPISTTTQNLPPVVTCNRGLKTDPTDVNVQLGIKGGKYPRPSTLYPRAKMGSSNYIDYNFYMVGCEVANWGGTSNWQSKGWTFANNEYGPTANRSASFNQLYACVSSVQYPPTGVYMDDVQMYLCWTGMPNCGAAVVYTTVVNGVQITVNNGCGDFVAPGNINLPYTSFQNFDRIVSVPFKLTCNPGYAPVSIDVSPASGTLAGVPYSLTWDPPKSGTGLPQTYNITATASRNYSGDCANAVGAGNCSATQITTLTITY